MCIHVHICIVKTHDLKTGPRNKIQWSWIFFKKYFSFNQTAVVKCCQLCPPGQLCQSVKTVFASESEFTQLQFLRQVWGVGVGVVSSLCLGNSQQNS